MTRRPGTRPATASSSDDYLARTAQALWPGARVRLSRSAPRRRAAVGRAAGETEYGSARGSDDASWFLLPSIRQPRMLLPVRCRAAAVMLNRHDSSRREAWARAVLRGAVSSGWLDRLPVRRLVVDATSSGAGDLAEHLGRLLGEPVRIGVLLGPVRANAKPVVQAFARSGRTLAFGKLDAGGTGHLVEREAVALTTLATAGLVGVEVPSLLHHGRWHGRALTLLSALDASQSRATDDAPHLGAAAEIAAAPGLRFLPLGDVLSRLKGRVAALPPGPGAARLGLVLDQLGRTAGADPLPVGAWHGDWSPWNMRRSATGGRLQVWDWERFDTGAAYGLDAVHHRAQLLWRDGVPAAACRPALEEAGRAMPAPAGGPPVPAGVLRRLYLVEIGARYLGDQPSGTPPRPRTRWVLDQLSPTTSDADGDRRHGTA